MATVSHNVNLKTLMPAWAECAGQHSDVIVRTSLGSVHSAAGPGDTWGVSPGLLATSLVGWAAGRGSQHPACANHKAGFAFIASR